MAPHTGETVLDALASLTSDDLLLFLTRQRWFAAKGATATDARIADAVVMPWGAGAFAMTRMIVQAGGADHSYQVPVAACQADDCDIPDGATIAWFGALTIFDAMYDPDFRQGLSTALATGLAVSGANGSRWLVEPIGGDRLPADEHVATTVISAEQSNTSFVIGNRAIVKLFRALVPGLHPDVEVTRFLTERARFAHIPPLLATMSFTTGGDRTTSGMAQEFLPGSTDAWSYALERGRDYWAAPADRPAPNTFADDAKRLGAITREMHEALASDDDDPAFAPEPVADDDLARWVQRTQQSIRGALALLERQLTSPAFPAERLAEAAALVRRRDHYMGWVSEIDDQLGDDLGMRIRVHGDYHLGQVLRTRTGAFMIIDFEGEPAKSLEERREKTSPLRDVAGMLRSFAYAAATLAMSADKTIDLHTRELRSARWERDVRAAYLAGYLGDPAERDDHPDVIPEENAHVRQLIALFETEKAFYELAYELNNRPAWAWIPMRGIAKLFTR